LFLDLGDYFRLEFLVAKTLLTGVGIHCLTAEILRTRELFAAETLLTIIGTLFLRPPDLRIAVSGELLG
jgi:hypothetical protein